MERSLIVRSCYWSRDYGKQRALMENLPLPTDIIERISSESRDGKRFLEEGSAVSGKRIWDYVKQMIPDSPSHQGHEMGTSSACALCGKVMG